METNDLPPLSEDPVLQKLSAESIDKADLRREEERYRELVASFANLIREDVRGALTKVPAAEVSEELVQAAKALLGYQPAAESEETKQIDRIRAELAAELQTDIGPADDEEVEEHTIELSQCLVSNWLGVLQRALDHRHPNNRPIELTTDALPGDIYLRTRLFQGVGFYVLPNLLLEDRFKRFLETLQSAAVAKLSIGERCHRVYEKTLGRPTFVSISLAPDMALVAEPRGPWYLTAGQAEAEELIGRLRSEAEVILEPGLAAAYLRAPRLDWVFPVIEVSIGSRYRPQWDHGTVEALIQSAMLEAPHEAWTGVFENWTEAHTSDATAQLSKEVIDVLHTAVDPNRFSSAEVYDTVQSRLLKICDILDNSSKYSRVPKLEACQVVLGALSVAVAARMTREKAEVMAADVLGNKRLTGPLTGEEELVVNLARGTVAEVLQTEHICSSIAALSQA